VSGGEGSGAEGERRTAVLGLGGNIGEPRRLMGEALARLGASGVAVERVSSLYRTPPWGLAEQPAFLNAAARVSTSLSPRGLLDLVLSTERALGRDRRVRWGPRTIDIDILLYGDPASPETVEEPGLTLPHLHLQERAFALMPLLDVAPEARVRGWPVAVWLARMDTGGIERVAEPGWEAQP